MYKRQAEAAVDFFPPTAFGAAAVFRPAPPRRRIGVTSASVPLSAAASPAPSSPPSPREAFAARTLFSSAAIRSITCPPAGSTVASAGSNAPPAFAAIIASTASR